MIKIFKREERGFSLVELMIVVAIIAILAAIAIPAFMKFAMKSKTSEATANLNAIRTCQEAYRAEDDVYAVCILSPRDTPTADPAVWIDNGDDPDPSADPPVVGTNFGNIGFEPDGDVRYTYEVTVPSANVFIAVATGDLDGNSLPAIFTLEKGATGYPRPVKSGDDF